MTTLAFDSEFNGLREVIIDKNGLVWPEVSEVHCLCMQDVDTGEAWRYSSRMGNMEEGWRRLMSADLLVSHNGTDADLPILRRLVAPPLHDPRNEPKHIDTLVWSRFLYPDHKRHPNRKYSSKPNSLEAWGKRLGCHKGDFKGPWDVLTTEMLDYCGQDVTVLVKLFKHLLPKMQRWKVHSRLEHEIARITVMMSENGVSFDLEGATRFQRDLTEEKAEVFDAMMRVFPPLVEGMKQPAYWYDPETMRGYKTKGSCKVGKVRNRLAKGPVRYRLHPFNPNSEDQIAARLIEKYGWRPSELTDTGKPKVTEKVLLSLSYPEAATIARYMMVEKRLSMLKGWMTRAETSRDGRIHPGYNPLGTNTHRYTHSQPNITQPAKVQLDDDGQPVPGYDGRWGLECRRLFKCRDGWVQVGADADSLELRMLAHITHPFDNGAYGRVMLQGHVHEYNMDKITLILTRSQSKEVFFAGIYGAGYWKLGTVLRTHKSLTPKQRKHYGKAKPVKIGKRFKAELDRGIPALGRAMASCKKLHFDNGRIKLLDGRYAPTRSGHSALNTKSQGNGAVICRLALVLAHRRLEKEHGPHGGRWAWMIFAHDEMQVECEPSIAEDIGKIMAWSFGESGHRLKCRIPTPGSFKIGKDWSETH